MSDGIILQIQPFGNAVKVIAVHEETGTEVSFMAPHNTPMLSLKMLARKKLEYVLTKSNPV